MMKLKYITFIFENCDSITIEGKYIGCFLVDDLRTRFERMACNSIDKIEVAHTFAIEIHSDANKERYAFEQTHIDGFRQMTFDRLNEYHDITAIEFELEEKIWDKNDNLKEVKKESYYYLIHWTGDNEYVNASQVNYTSDCEHLYIVVAENKGIKDFFDLEEINDEEAMDFSFQICDVGDKYNNGN